VEIVKQDYQPTKAEAEEVIVLRNPDGSVPEPVDLARALTEPVEITYLEKPKR
jgi:hypothetical protein